VEDPERGLAPADRAARLLLQLLQSTTELSGVAERSLQPAQPAPPADWGTDSGKKGSGFRWLGFLRRRGGHGAAGSGVTETSEIVGLLSGCLAELV